MHHEGTKGTVNEIIKTQTIYYKLQKLKENLYCKTKRSFLFQTACSLYFKKKLKEKFRLSQPVCVVREIGIYFIFLLFCKLKCVLLSDKTENHFSSEHRNKR